MKTRIGMLLAMSLVSLSACNSKGTEKLADRVENAADNRADAIKAADVNASAMSQEQRDAIVANQAAAVR